MEGQAFSSVHSEENEMETSPNKALEMTLLSVKEWVEGKI